MARWSSPKDPALEAALRRNRRWIVNNQIKRLLLRFPSRSAPVRLLQSRFKTLDLLGRAANWLRKWEFGLPEDTARMLLRHSCLFYVSNRYKIHTAVLREGYEGSELRVKDPVVAAKDRLGELMQEGLHEFNQRRRAVNLEKKRRKGEVDVKKEEEELEDEAGALLDSAEKREERRRFYKVLFGDDNR
ncbi:unnamed protein product [Triticum turgidum subsp. durum]|uniref:PORR domain-containing protein n=1 Tax=Triticum turgidum subsp. durum TaxID=4567 RepID=A0A9R0ZXE9_TRITD|nr:unnamed protein product [Triticum turgidum subsp. durum]VAI85013.1 unnamed protein product [Triticum turgidum subsp. durum]